MKKIMVVLALSLGVLGVVSGTTEKPAKAGNCYGYRPHCLPLSFLACVCDSRGDCYFACVEK